MDGAPSLRDLGQSSPTGIVTLDPKVARLVDEESHSGKDRRDAAEFAIAPT